VLYIFVLVLLLGKAIYYSWSLFPAPWTRNGVARTGSRFAILCRCSCRASARLKRVIGPAGGNTLRRMPTTVRPVGSRQRPTLLRTIVLSRGVPPPLSQSDARSVPENHSAARGARTAEHRNLRGVIDRVAVDHTRCLP